MNSRAVILTILFFISAVCAVDKIIGVKKEELGLFTTVEDTLELKLGAYANTFTEWLARFNDDHLGHGEIGKFFHYNEIKPKTETAGKEGRNMKKLSLALIPLIFHVGAASTWMLVSAILTAKSVAIGLVLLIFKIAVSSAKISSFFTLLKAKHHHYEWTPHSEHHHGDKRSLTDVDHHPTFVDHPTSHDDYNSYKLEWTPNEKSISTFKQPEPYSGYAESRNIKVYGKN